MATTVTISSKGQITLPKELRDRHHLGAGEEALVVDTEAGILIRPRPRQKLYGLLKGRIEAADLERSIRQLRRETSP
ncbi:MAG TPA: AbrB/MazE/SpoVT family DNA-binding domain-containing protein [Thermoplasmata archaeon]|nr:AbrB/MazE/SpoVT family DNA-binding domain-containing protein [Thermoplasmata archaeon]